MKPMRTREKQAAIAERMRLVRRADTAPETIVRKLLHRLGFRFRLHRRDLPGTPDIALPRWKTVIFVHGCFWHRHAHCVKATTPKTNRRFWLDKFAANQRRDRRVAGQLRRLGWNVVTVWECETANRKALERRVKRSLMFQR